jgi:hypothetical protein
MEIEPKNPNLPLQRSTRFVLVAACGIALAIAWLLNPGVALVFSISCVVGLPVLWLFFVQPHVLRPRRSDLLTYALMFFYLVLAEFVFIPSLVSLFHASTRPTPSIGRMLPGKPDGDSHIKR